MENQREEICTPHDICSTRAQVRVGMVSKVSLHVHQLQPITGPLHELCRIPLGARKLSCLRQQRHTDSQRLEHRSRLYTFRPRLLSDPKRSSWWYQWLVPGWGRGKALV